jgi:enhancer of polycomb-like protein
MPRAHNPGPSTLRNRNRVTNKTRLHIVHGSLDADPLAFDEDEEKARIVSTAGVDAEDANVSPHFLLHHAFQPLMLSGAWWRFLIGCYRENFIPRNADSLTFYRNTTSKLSCQLPRNATRLPAPPVVPGIGLPNNRMPTSQSRIMPDLWKHPTGGVIQSHTSRHPRRLRKPHKTPSLMASTYFMDERDKEWLDKNNEEARGEGTSAQGSCFNVRHDNEDLPTQRKSEGQGARCRPTHRHF